MSRFSIPMETVTPLYSGGSEPGGTPEVRASSVRGALRFWLRALLGGHLGDRDIARLRREEATVFGGVQQESPSASQLLVRVAASGHARALEPPASAQGLRYLFFSMATRVRDRAGQRTTTVWRQCLPPGAPLELQIGARRPCRPGDADPLVLGAASCWLLIRLGGLGARSRRGAGGIRALREPASWPAGLPGVCVRAAKPAELKLELEAGVTAIRHATGLPSAASLPALSAFDVLHPDCCQIFITDRVWRSWTEALDAVGLAFQKFRSRREPDYRNVKDAVLGRAREIEPVRRGAFGLPIVFYFRSLQGARGVLEGAEHDRRASPLAFKIERLSAGSYTILLVVFRSALLEEGEDLRLRTQARSVFGVAPDLEIVDDFVSALRKPGPHFVGHLVEVNLR